MEERKKEVTAKVSEMDDVSTLIPLPKGVSYLKGIDVNQCTAEYYGTKHDIDKLK